MTRREQKINWAREYLVRFGNRVVMRKQLTPAGYKAFGFTPGQLDANIRHLWRKLMNTPSDVLMTALLNLSTEELLLKGEMRRMLDAITECEKHHE